MKRKFLANMGLSKAQIDTILDENSQDIGKTKAELASVQTELNLLKINAAVENALFMLKAAEQEMKVPHRGCPGMQMHQMTHPKKKEMPAHTLAGVSRLGQWPCQMKLVPVNAPYFDGAKLLIAADCTAYAYANMHEDFMKGKVTLIGCPKCDAVDYSEKLTEIIGNHDIKSVTILRMEVPCCGGLETAVKKALQESGKFIPWQRITISIDGTILED